MAYKYILRYKDANDKTITHTIQPALQTATAATVKAAMQTVITNGVIFKNVPVSMLDAKLVQTTETSITITD